MPFRPRARAPFAPPSLAAFLAAALTACTTPPEPPRAATPSVSTSTQTATAPTEASSSTAPSASASATAVTATQLAMLEKQIQEALDQSSNGPTLVSIGAGLPIGSGSASAGNNPPPVAQLVKGPVVAVAIGKVSVSGGSVSNAEPVAAGMAAGFRRCLNMALKEDPTSVQTGAKVVVKATLDEAGAVIAAAASSSMAMPAKAASCIAARVAAAQFAPPDPAPSTVLIPVSVQVTQAGQ